MHSPSGRRIAEDLLDIGAVAFSPRDPFTWASGLRSPVYCDNRVTISFPAVRRRIRDGFVAAIERRGLSVEAIVGTATAGIPHAAWLADALDLPMAYVRSKRKEHGRGSQVEGRIEEGRRVVVVEDLVSTGGSSMAVVDVLRREGAVVEAVLAIFSYELPESDAAFAAAGVLLETLTNFDLLLSAAQERALLTAEAATSIAAWREDPHAWSDQFR